MIPAFERAKRVHDLDRAAAVIGGLVIFVRTNAEVQFSSALSFSGTRICVAKISIIYT
jgi:hypothetical protein